MGQYGEIDETMIGILLKLQNAVITTFTGVLMD